MLRSATFKLTMYYVLIIAVLSISFSIELYHVATNDLAFGLQRQTQRISTDFPVFSHSPYLHQGNELAAGRHHIINRLIVLNVVVLATAGIVSYALARRTLQPIEDSHERQKRFTADVSHELRTPLTALTMESQVALLDKTAGKNQLREVIRSNVEEAEKLTALISTLLVLSQLDDTAVSPSTAVRLGTVVAAAVDDHRIAAKARSITLKYQQTDDWPITGDEAMLKQLFSVLLDNAIKYSPSGSAIQITQEMLPDTVAVRIADQGQGIARTDLEHVFERFYRADAARTSGASGGYGLGLSIAKRIADLHRASIQLTSRPGEGTTATVILPRDDGSTASDELADRYGRHQRQHDSQ